MRTIDGRTLSIGRSAAALGVLAVLLATVLLTQASQLFDGLQSEATSRTKRGFDIPALPARMMWPDTKGIATDGHSLFVPIVAASPAPPAPPPQPAQPQEQLSLLAIIIGPGGKFALLRAQPSGDVRQVREGEAVGAWSLSSVETNRVILEQGGQKSILYLPDTSPQKP